MAFYVNEIIKMLSCVEELLGIVIDIFSGDWRAYHNIDAMVPVELHHLSLIDSTLTVINLVHHIENSIDTRIFELLDIHFVKWI